MNRNKKLAIAGTAILAVAGTVAFAASGSRAGSAQETASAAPAPAAATVKATFACPMHPEVTSATRDRCPRCGMYLEEVKASAPASPAATTANARKCPYRSGQMKPLAAHHRGAQGCCKDGAHARGECPHEKAAPGGKGGK